MKKLPFALLSMISCAVLISCQNADYDVPYTKYGWEHFPFELFTPYVFSENTLLTYVTDQNDTLIIQANRPFISCIGRTKTANDDLYEIAEFYFEYRYMKSLENVILEQIFTIVYSTVPITCENLFMYRMITSYGREELNVELSSDFKTQADKVYENKNVAIRPDEIFQNLRDTLNLGKHRTLPGDGSAIIVRNRGLVSFRYTPWASVNRDPNAKTYEFNLVSAVKN